MEEGKGAILFKNKEAFTECKTPSQQRSAASCAGEFLSTASVCSTGYRHVAYLVEKSNMRH